MRDERMSTLPHCATNESFSLTRNAAGRLVLSKANGEIHVGVEPVRSFPITDPDRFISLVDSHAHELLCIGDLAELDPEIARVIRRELAEREFLPRIERIV